MQKKHIDFRLLNAEEIDCRVAQCTQYGATFLLYKDARCDQNILDETVGCMNWQRSHARDNANCIVSIWDDEKKMWVSKEDTGKESNTEAEKGLASDSFKRACFNWGIGRELYTSPEIKFKKKDLNSHKEVGEYQGKKKYACYDKLMVTGIEYEGRKISKVTILNIDTGVSFEFGDSVPTPINEPQEGVLLATESKKATIKQLCEKQGVNADKWLSQNGRTWETLTENEATQMLLTLKDREKKG